MKKPTSKIQAETNKSSSLRPLKRSVLLASKRNDADQSLEALQNKESNEKNTFDQGLDVAFIDLFNDSLSSDTLLAQSSSTADWIRYPKPEASVIEKTGTPPAVSSPLTPSDSTADWIRYPGPETSVIEKTGTPPEVIPPITSSDNRSLFETASTAAFDFKFIGGALGLGVALSGAGGGGGNAGTGTYVTTVAPALQTLVIHSNGGGAGQATIELFFDSAIDAAHLPNISAFTVTVNGQANSVTGVSSSGSTLVLNLQSAVIAGAITARVEYIDPTTGNDINAIQSTSGTDAMSFAVISGIVADGYVRDAQIYLQKPDGSLQLLSGVVTNQYGNFFLRDGINPNNYALVAVGGVNIDTGLPNTLALKGPAGATTINPLTTLVSEIMSQTGKNASEAESIVSGKLGLTNALGGNSLLYYDPLASNNTVVQKAAAQIASMATMVVNKTGVSTSADTVLSNVAVELINAGGNNTVISLSDSTLIGNLLQGIPNKPADLQTSLTTAMQAINGAINNATIAQLQTQYLDNVSPGAPVSIISPQQINNATPDLRINLSVAATDGTAAVAGDKLVVLEGGATVAEGTLTTQDIVNGYKTLTPAPLSSGVHVFTAQLVDLAGNRSSLSASLSITVDAVAPSVSSIGIVSSIGAVNTWLNAGDSVSVSANFSEAVTVVGSPKLALNIGGNTAQASYVSGSGSSTLLFTYTILATENDADGISIDANGLSLNGGSIKDAAGNAATLSNVVVASNSGFRVDTSAPTISSGLTATGIAENSGANQAVYTVTSADLGANGQYALQSGGDAVSFSIDPSSGIVTLLSNPNFESKSSYTFTITATDAAGNVTEKSVSLAIADANEAPIAISSISAIQKPLNQAFSVDLHGYFSDVDIAGTWGSLTYAISSGTLPAGLSLNSTTGVLSGTPSVLLNATSLTVTATDGGGLTASQSFTLGVVDISNDVAAPTVVSAELSASTSSQNNTLNVADTVSVTVTFSEAVNVTGVPFLELDIGGTIVQAEYVSGSGTNTLSFRYAIEATLNDNNGISIKADALKLNGASIADLAGNAAVISFALVGDNAAYKVDTDVPQLLASSPADDSQAVLPKSSILLTFNEPIQAGAGTILISNGSDTRSIAIGDTTQIGISANVLTVNLATALQLNSNYSVQFAGGVVTDLAGNSFAGISGSTAFNFKTAAADAGSAVTVYHTDIFGASFIPSYAAQVVAAGSVTSPDLLLSAVGSGNTITVTSQTASQQIQFPYATPQPIGFTADLQKLVFQSDMLWYKGFTQSDYYDKALFTFDIASGSINLLTHDATSGYKTQGAAANYLDFSADRKWLVFSANDASKFGNAIPFTDSQPTAADLLVVSANTGEIRLISGHAGISLGSAATYQGLSADGNTLYFKSNNVGGLIAEQSLPVVDVTGSGTADLVAMRLNLLDLATVSDTAGTASGDLTPFDNITGAKSLTITAQLPASSAAILYDNGAAVADGQVTADANGLATWNLTNVATGSHTYTLYDPTYKKQILLDGSVEASRLVVSVVSDTQAPVLSNVALTSATGGAPGYVLYATASFSEAVNVNGTPTLNLDVGGNVVQASYASGSGTASLVFSYTIQNGETDPDGVSIPANGITGGTITDFAGNSALLTFASIPSNSNYLIDSVAPSLASSTPSDNASNVGLTSSVTLNFSETVKLGTGNIIISNGVDIRSIPVTDSSQVTFNGSTVTITSASNFQTNTTYSVQMAVGVIKDSAGNNFAGISDNTTLNFTTTAVDQIAPVLSSTPTVAGATSLAVDSNIVLKFSEAIKAGSGNIVITDGTDTRTISITDTTQVTINGDTLTVNPSNPLWLSTQSSSGPNAPNTVINRNYSLTVQAGAIKDLANNLFAGIDSAHALQFTTASSSLTKVQITGDTSNRVDIAVIGDGYQANEIANGKLSTDVSAFADYLFKKGDISQPFGRYASFFNVYSIDVASVDSGVDMNYQYNLEKPQVNTALDGQQLPSLDRLLTVSGTKADAVAAAALAGLGVTIDLKVASINSPVYGGAGGTWATFSGASVDISGLEVALHEIGHSYVGLADEYVDNVIAPTKVYTGGTDFGKANVTSNANATPWSAWLGQYQPGIGVIGAYQGANYYESGAYRPTDSSKMRATGKLFDVVSREAFILSMYKNVDPLDAYSANDSRNLAINVTPIDPTLIDLTWTVDGFVQSSGGTFLDLSELGAGAHTISVVAKDNSGWIRPDYMSQATQTLTWSVVIQSAVALTSGNDTFSANTNGWIQSGNGNDTVVGTARNDKLVGGAGNDVLSGGDGDDILVGGDGTNTLDGGLGINTVSYQGVSSPVTVSLAISGAQQTSSTSTDTLLNVQNLIGGSGADSLTGNDVANYLQGLDGDDNLKGGAGNNILEGGRGNDTIEAGNGNNRISGGVGDDSITVGNGNNLIYGDDGNEIIVAGSGDNRIFGGDGNDQITVGGGSNLINAGAGNDAVNGGAGNDVIQGGSGTNTLNGGAGSNTLSYEEANVNLYVSLAVTTAQTTGYSIDTISNFQNLIGGSGNDTLIGSVASNTLQGGLGNDLLIGGAGDDVYVGGGGNDTVSFSGATQGVIATLLPTNPTIDYATGKAIGVATGEGSDTLWQISNLIGSHYDDQLTGDNFANLLNGGGGGDVLTGGGGADTFVFSSAIDQSVTITDFVSGNDYIDLSALIFSGLGNTGALDSAKFYKGATAHSTTDRIVYNDTTGVLSYDSDGNGSSAAVVFAVLSNKPQTLSPSDFVVI